MEEYYSGPFIEIAPSAYEYEYRRYISGNKSSTVIEPDVQSPVLTTLYAPSTIKSDHKLNCRPYPNQNYLT